ncbi:hypothetical protein DFJ77DRAFT_140719 [Powellomyces hirtus]|nr:hypothetical protein DFJ77DRAFT_140719 [Powellomyces hirtus]
MCDMTIFRPRPWNVVQAICFQNSDRKCQRKTTGLRPQLLAREVCRYSPVPLFRQCWESSMIRRFCRGTYNEDDKKTIGVEYLKRRWRSVWRSDVDVAGYRRQEEFDGITRELLQRDAYHSRRCWRTSHV